MGQAVTAILADVAKIIETTANESAQNELKAALVKRAIDARAETLLKALDKRTELNSELKKLVPDQSQGVNPANGEETKLFSKERWEKKKEVEAKIAKLENLLEEALNKDEYSKLRDLVNK